MRNYFRLLSCALLLLLALPAAAARLPMYQTYSYTSNDWFYTVSPSQRDLAISYGFLDYGIAFYVDDGSTPGAVPLYRFYKGPPQTDHFYTHDLGEYSTVIGYGWEAEGNEGYVFGSPPAGATAIYRLAYYDGATGDLQHFYTYNWSQAQQLSYQGWGLDSTIFYAYTTGDPPPPTPRLVHATQLTASCADKYCARLTGYDFAANAYIEMRSGSSTGPVIWTEANVARNMSGEATTLDVVLTNPGVHDTLDHGDGIWFFVVNPGNPSNPNPAKSAGLNVVRDHPYSLRGGTMDFDSHFLNGYACTDRDFSAALNVTVRSGSDSGEVGEVLPAAFGGAPLFNECGGNTSHLFSTQWPAKWRNGATREIYLVANIDPAGTASYRYENGLLPGSPRTITFDNVPWDATALSPLPLTVPRGTSSPVTVTWKNRGYMQWVPQATEDVAMTQFSGQVSWMPESVGLNITVQPDGTATFNYGFAVPSNAPSGTYDVRYRLRHGQSAIFFGPTALVRVTVP